MRRREVVSYRSHVDGFLEWRWRILLAVHIKRGIIKYYWQTLGDRIRDIIDFYNTS